MQKYPPRDAERFFKWWKTFNEDQQGRADCKVYRKYPVIDQVLAGGKHKDRIDVIEGAIPFEPEEFKSHFLHHYGSGKYSLIMNEKGVPGIICTCAFEVDDQNYPPRVDLKTLVRGHPENRGFEEGLKARGVKFPGEENTEEDVEDMTVAGQLVGKVLDQNAQLSQQVAELAEERAASADPIAQATSEAIGVIAEGAKAAIQMTRENAADISKAAAPQWNPMEILRQGIELSKGNGDNGAAMLTTVLQMQQGFFTQMLELQRQNFEALRQSQSVAAAPAKSDLDTLMEKATQFKGLMDMFTGGRRESSSIGERVPVGKSIIQTIAENPEVMTALSGVAGSVTQMVMAWLSRPQLGAINPAQPATAEIRPVNGVGPQPVAKQPTPEEVQRQAALEQQTAFLKMIEKPLIAHFFDTERRGLSGYTFADAMQQQFQGTGEITPQGRLMYETVISWQPITLQKLCENYADIFNVCGGNKVKWNQFFHEFSTYDQWRRVEQERLQQVGGTPN